MALAAKPSKIARKAITLMARMKSFDQRSGAGKASRWTVGTTCSVKSSSTSSSTVSRASRMALDATWASPMLAPKYMVRSVSSSSSGAAWRQLPLASPPAPLSST